jgi:hypothetical protein
MAVLPPPLQSLVADEAVSAYIPARRNVVLMDEVCIAACALDSVRKGFASVPGSLSLPLGAT